MSYKARILSCDFPFHITGRTNNKEKFPVPIEEVWDLLSNYLFFINVAYGIKIHAFVLMPNHFHLIASDPQLILPEAMNYFMRETSKIMSRSCGKINRLWGSPYHSSLINSPLYYLHAYKYVYRNPVRAHLTAACLDYEFSTLRSLLGFGRTIIPLIEDDTLFSGLEEALCWLEQAPLLEHTESVRLALRRKEFKLPRCEKTKKPNFLENGSSVPDFFRKGRAFPGG